MRYYLITWILAIGSLNLACSSIKTYTEAPNEQSVSHFKTFAFVSVDESEMDHGSRILYEEIRKDITNQLREKDYRPNTEDPEILIVFNILTDEQRKEVTRSSDPYGAFGRRMWPYYSPYGPGWFPQDQYRYKEVQIEKTGTMVIDLYDNQKRELVWRGIGTGPVNDPEQRFETTFKMVDKMFKEFPMSIAGPVSASN
ncbi:MAG: DUF4136 domain-containing protein [Bacteroidota bacterium]